LFPGYAFVLIELQWHAARWDPGTCGLIMDGAQPARVPDAVIGEIRSRERGGLVELPKLRLEPCASAGFAGPLRDHIGLFAALRPHERVRWYCCDCSAGSNGSSWQGAPSRAV
jgi:hypothetical protein